MNQSLGAIGSCERIGECYECLSAVLLSRGLKRPLRALPDGAIRFVLIVFSIAKRHILTLS